VCRENTGSKVFSANSNRPKDDIVKTVFAIALGVVVASSPASAQDYRVEVIDAAPDADEISTELAGVLQTKGYRVIRGTSRTVCEIWLTKSWEVTSDFEATQERLYPLTQGQLLGVMHLPRRGKDFRDQSISSGWYTMRFALQPVDGNHVGTSLTRDFVVLIEAEKDAPDKTWDPMALMMASAEAAGSTHPAMLCLQKSSEGAEAAVRHNETLDWWILNVNGRNTQDGTVPLDLVVAGQALE